MQANGFPIQINTTNRKKVNDMTENENNRINGSAENNGKVISDLETLSHKYGLSFNASSYKTPDTDNDTPVSTISQSSPYTAQPRNNRPAGVPVTSFNPETAFGSIKLVYQNGENSPSGPEGRRLIYSEPETESIAEKRKRNRSAKGSQGFGAQPYVRHVASSENAMRRDDADAFRREYEVKKSNNETNRESANTVVPRTSARLVATNNNENSDRPVFQHYELTAGEKAGRFFRSFIPWKGDGAKEIARKIIMNISAVLVVLCFVYFIDNYIQHQDKIENNQEIIEMQTNAPTDNLEQRWAEIKAKYPDVDFPEGMNIKYAELYAQNQDFVGWLKIDNTNIDTPIVQSKLDSEGNGNDEFYLRRNFYKEDDKYGNPFLDSYNAGSELDTNNIIYGHNMTDGLSFAQLEKYYTVDGFKESPIIRYSTLYKDYYFKVYAVFVTNGSHAGDNNYLFDYTITNFTGEENFGTFIEAIDERKLYDTGVDITPSDKILTLSTCSYEIKANQMGRLAVVGRLVREGESTAVDTSLVTVNPNPRYPQIWYDEHGMSNPYRDAFQWIPQ